MASTTKREGKRGTRYDVRYRDPSGRVHTRTFTTRRDARKFGATTQADLVRGAWIDPNRGKVTLDDYAEQWLHNRPDLRPNTVALR